MEQFEREKKANVIRCNIFQISKALDKDKPGGPPVAIAIELLGPLLPFKANVRDVILIFVCVLTCVFSCASCS